MARSTVKTTDSNVKRNSRKTAPKRRTPQPASQEPLPPLDPNRLLRPEEVAPRLSVSMSTLRRLITAGRLPVVRVGHAIRIRPQDLEGFIASSLEQKPLEG